METAVAIGLHTEGITTNLKYSVGPQVCMLTSVVLTLLNLT